jgi:hypothetical protein
MRRGIGLYCRLPIAYSLYEIVNVRIRLLQSIRRRNSRQSVTILEYFRNYFSWRVMYQIIPE